MWSNVHPFAQQWNPSRLRHPSPLPCSSPSSTERSRCAAHPHFPGGVHAHTGCDPLQFWPPPTDTLSLPTPPRRNLPAHTTGSSSISTFYTSPAPALASAPAPSTASASAPAGRSSAPGAAAGVTAAAAPAPLIALRQAAAAVEPAWGANADSAGGRLPRHPRPSPPRGRACRPWRARAARGAAPPWTQKNYNKRPHNSRHFPSRFPTLRKCVQSLFTFQHIPLNNVSVTRA